MVYLPGFFSGKVQNGRYLQPVYQHPADEVGIVELLAIVGTQIVYVLLPCFVEHFVETSQQFSLVISPIGFDP